MYPSVDLPTTLTCGVKSAVESMRACPMCRMINKASITLNGGETKGIIDVQKLRSKQEWTQMSEDEGNERRHERMSEGNEQSRRVCTSNRKVEKKRRKGDEVASNS